MRNLFFFKKENNNNLRYNNFSIGLNKHNKKNKHWTISQPIVVDYQAYKRYKRALVLATVTIAPTKREEEANTFWTYHHHHIQEDNLLNCNIERTIIQMLWWWLVRRINLIHNLRRDCFAIRIVIGRIIEHLRLLIIDLHKVVRLINIGMMGRVLIETTIKSLKITITLIIVVSMRTFVTQWRS